MKSSYRVRTLLLVVTMSLSVECTPEAQLIFPKNESRCRVFNRQYDEPLYCSQWGDSTGLYINTWVPKDYHDDEIWEIHYSKEYNTAVFYNIHHSKVLNDHFWLAQLRSDHNVVRGNNGDNRNFIINAQGGGFFKIKSHIDGKFVTATSQLCFTSRRCVEMTSSSGHDSDWRLVC